MNPKNKNKKRREGPPYKHLNTNPITFTKLNRDTHDRITRISEEFKNGFTLISGSKLSVTFWGSARTSPDDPDYKKAYRLAKRISKLGYTIVTGGGPGIMAAGNCGAYDAGGKSVGLTIKLPEEQITNLCLTHHMDFEYFFVRKVCLAFAAEAYLFFPGGFGTLDEFFEILCLTQTKKISPAPTIILVGKKYWKNLDKFIKRELLSRKKISSKDINIYNITDDEDEIIELIKKSPIRKN
jgi:uncharacterized protein (TIGR00730 family)